MLIELRVRQLGVIDDIAVVFGPGMTALTGETGAGKTLVVGAIELLLGGRPDPMLVRPGADEASVEGRFAGGGPDGDDLILARVVPATGRARAYVDGRMSSAAAIAEAGSALVDLHGQNAHQSLLSPAVQRQALDAIGGIDLAPLAAARAQLRQIREELAGLGGDARSRAREIDLLRFQLDEIAAANVKDPDEEEALLAEEERLADAGAHRQTAAQVYETLAGDEGVLDRLGSAVGSVAGRPALVGVHDRLRSLSAELADAARDARDLSETLEDDPERLAAISNRRRLLADLRRKYGETLTEVIDYRESAGERLTALESHEWRAAELEGAQVAANAAVASAAEQVGRARRAAAPAFGAAIEGRLQVLAMSRAHFEVVVADSPAGEEVTWMLGANPGEPVLPLTKVASGGELARTMLAARLVLTESSGPPSSTVAHPPDPAPGGVRTLVFDEVDAGIGGEAAVAVGRALVALADHYQVIVVTHLAQVAAFAHQHLAVRKHVVGDRTVSEIETLDGARRVVELSRMLSGQPESATARRHAEELLATARGPGR